MNKFSENLRKLMQESKLSDKELLTELMEKRIYVERQKLKSWFKGKVPEDRILEALAKIFSEVSKREVTVDELLGKGGER